MLAALLVVVTPSIALAQAGWYLTPSLSVSESYDDNIFRSSTNRQHDFITSITPGVRLAYQSAPLTFIGSYSTTYQKFVEHPELDNFDTNQAGTLSLSYVPAPLPWTLSLSASYARVDDLNEVDVAATDQGRRIATVFSAQGALTYKLTPATSVIGGLSYSRSEVENLATTDTLGANLSLRHQFTQSDTGSLNYTFNAFERAGADTRLSHSLTVGYERQLMEDLSAVVKLGVRITDGRVTPDVSATLDGAIRPIQGLSLSAGYSDTVRFVVGERDPEEVRTLALTATYAPPWIQYLTMTAGPSVSYVSKLDGSDDRVIYGARAAVTYSYPITRWLNAQVSYTFSFRENGAAVIRNLVSFGLSASYPIRLY
jgi:hypothetical protein